MVLLFPCGLVLCLGGRKGDYLGLGKGVLCIPVETSVLALYGEITLQRLQSCIMYILLVFFSEISVMVTYVHFFSLVLLSVW